MPWCSAPCSTSAPEGVRHKRADMAPLPTPSSCFWSCL
jgi:hypothetical protein